jgi:hypothetical protein
MYFDPNDFYVRDDDSSAAGGGIHEITEEEVYHLAHKDNLKKPYELQIVQYNDGYINFDFGIDLFEQYRSTLVTHRVFRYDQMTNKDALDIALATYNQIKLEKHPELGVGTVRSLSYKGSIGDAEREHVEQFVTFLKINKRIKDKKRAIELVKPTIEASNALDLETDKLLQNKKSVADILKIIEAHKHLQIKTLTKVRCKYGEVIDLVITTILSMFGCIFLMTGVIYGSLIPFIFWWIELDMIELMEKKESERTGVLPDKGPKRADRKRFFEILFSHINLSRDDAFVQGPDVFSNTRTFLELLCQHMNGNPNSTFFGCITGGSVFYICASALLNIYNSGGNFENLNDVNKSTMQTMPDNYVKVRLVIDCVITAFDGNKTYTVQDEMGFNHQVNVTDILLPFVQPAIGVPVKFTNNHGIVIDGTMDGFSEDGTGVHVYNEYGPLQFADVQNYGNIERISVPIPIDQLQFPLVTPEAGVFVKANIIMICEMKNVNADGSADIIGSNNKNYTVSQNDISQLNTDEKFRFIYDEMRNHPNIELIQRLSADGNSDIDIKICINKCDEAKRANYLKIAEELFKKHERESGLPMFSSYYGLLFGPAFGPATDEVPDPINNALDGMDPSIFFAEFERGAYGTTAGFQMSRYQWAERSEVDDNEEEIVDTENKLSCKTACDSLGISNVYAQMVQESGFAQFDRLLQTPNLTPERIRAIEKCKKCYERALAKKKKIKELTQLISKNVGLYDMMVNDPAASGCVSRFTTLKRITDVISDHLEKTYSRTNSDNYLNVLIAHSSIENLNRRNLINGSASVFMLPQIMINIVGIPEIRGIILLSQASNDVSRGLRIYNALGIVRANPSIGTAITSRDISSYFRKTLQKQSLEGEQIELAPNTRVSFSAIAKPHGTQDKDAADIAEGAVDEEADQTTSAWIDPKITNNRIDVEMVEDDAEDDAEYVAEDLNLEDVDGGGSWRKKNIKQLQHKIKNNRKIKKTNKNLRKPQKRKTKRTNPRKTKQRKQPKQKISKKRSKK